MFPRLACCPGTRHWMATQMRSVRTTDSPHAAAWERVVPRVRLAYGSLQGGWSGIPFVGRPDGHAGRLVSLVHPAKVTGFYTLISRRRVAIRSSASSAWALLHRRNRRRTVRARMRNQPSPPASFGTAQIGATPSLLCPPFSGEMAQQPPISCRAPGLGTPTRGDVPKSTSQNCEGEPATFWSKAARMCRVPAHIWPNSAPAYL